MNTIQQIVRGSKRESGMVAIMVTMILMIVISLIVLGFAEISRRNQRQTVDRQLSTQAFYAAESGINDASQIIRAALASGTTVPDKPDCDFNAGGFYGGLDPIIDANSSVQYTCLTVDPTPASLEYSNIGSSSTVIPLQTTSGTIASITFTWQTKEDAVTPANSCLADLTEPFLTASAWTTSDCGYGVLRFDLVSASGAALGIDSLRTNTMTAFLVPLRPSGAGAAANPIGFTLPAAGNNRLGVRCSNSGCTQTINGLTSGQYYLRVSSMYKAVALRITAQDSGGSTLSMRGAQAIVDSTGKASDVLRRIQVRLPLSGSNENLSGDYALQTTDAICKRFSVMDGRFRNEADDAVPGVENSTTNPLCKPE